MTGHIAPRKKSKMSDRQQQQQQQDQKQEQEGQGEKKRKGRPSFVEEIDNVDSAFRLVKEAGDDSEGDDGKEESPTPPTK